jgi:hypothetical protein
MDIVTGERIQDLCEQFFGDLCDINYNPKFVNSQKWMFCNNKSINNKSVIFCYTHNVNTLFSMIDYFQNSFILVLHNSDGEINESHVKNIEHKKIIRVFSQNCVISNKKVHFLPIGIANSQWQHGNLSTFDKILNSKVDKLYNFYFNFSHTHKDRVIAEEILSKNFTKNKQLPYEEFLLDLKRHKYCFCPRGNGIDTHRFWECIYLNVIPICIECNFTKKLQSKYPQIILVKSYSEVNKNLLDNYQFPNFKAPSISKIARKIFPIVLY